MTAPLTEAQRERVRTALRDNPSAMTLQLARELSVPEAEVIRGQATSDETTRFSSMVMPGSRATSEPVAITIDLVSSVCAWPLAPLTSTLPGAAMRPMPWKVSTLFFLSRKATPLTLPSTPSSLNVIMAGRSSFGAPTAMPIFLNVWPACS